MVFLRTLGILCVLKICSILATSAGNPDAALLVGFEGTYNWNSWRNLVCVAKGSAATSALVFFSEKSSEISGITPYYGPEDKRKKMDELKLQYNYWEQFNMLDTIVGKYPLLDFRWEDLETKSTVDDDCISLPVTNEYWTLNLSVKANKDVYIYLCSRENLKSSCYWIIFGGWVNTKSGYRILKNGEKEYELTEEVSLDTKRWNHIMLQVAGNKLRFSLGSNFDKELEKGFDVNFVILTGNPANDKPLQWKIHNRNFFGTRVRNNYVEREWFEPTENRLCLSFFYYIPSSVPNAKLTINFYSFINSQISKIISEDITNIEGDKNQGWKRFEKTFDLTKWPGYVLFKLIATWSEELLWKYPLDVFAIDDVKLCSPEGSIHSLELRVKTASYEDLPSCHILQYPAVTLTAKEPEHYNLGCQTGHLLSDCSATCKGLFRGKYEDCTEAAICVPLGNATVCSCSRGHYGSGCLKCNTGAYGDFCSETCGTCKDRDTCDWATGVCPNGCELGYAASYCNQTYPRLNKAPTLIRASPSNLSFSVDFTDISGYGQPTAYEIQYKVILNTNNRIEWKKDGMHLINATNSIVTLHNLDVNTKYKLRVVLFVNKEYYVGKDLPTFEGTTTCKDIWVESSVPSETSIEVCWKEDDRLSCPLTDYSAELEDHSRGIKKLTFKGKSYPKFKHLEPYTGYIVRVVNSRSGGIVYNQTIWTLEALPTEPQNLNIVSISGSDSTVRWEQPKKPNGKLKKFIVIATVKKTWLLKGIVPNVTDEHNVMQDSLSYTHLVKDLQPSTLYSLSISGVTVGQGPEATLELQTPLVEPVYTEQLMLVRKSLTVSTASIILPPASEYLTDTSAYFVIVGCIDCPEEDSSGDQVVNETLLNKIWFHSGLNDSYIKWIAGEIQPENLEVNFTVGKNIKTDGYIFGKKYVNRPLHSSTTYEIVLVVLNKQGDNTTFATLKLPEDLNLCQLLNLPMDGGSGAGTSVLIAFCVLLVIILPLIIFFIYKRRTTFSSISRSKLAIKLTEPSKVEDDSYILKPPAPEPQSETEELNDNQPIKPQSHSRLSCRVVIEDLENFVMKGMMSGELQKQYMLFPRGQTQPWDYGKLPQNKSKNRYGNLIAYDRTRVILEKLPGDEYSDYINANYIDGYNAKMMYIATQGPKPNTVVDFWRMVWQEKVHVICMLANVVESGKKKCEHYWPDYGKEITHGNVAVQIDSEQLFADFSLKTLKVTCSGKNRKVVHLHFTSWPDHGVPFYPQSVAGYLKKLLATPRGPGPILVHCSAGVGRTGTIILADICLRMAASERAVDLLHYLHIIREQRANLVDNLEQFKLVHLVLIECLVEQHTSYSCNGLAKNVKRMRDSGILAKQFQHLEELRMQNHILQQTDSKTTGQAKESPLMHKNRFQDIVPGRSGRVYLSRNAVPDNNSDYINAVYVDGFRIRDQFIVTQYPLPSTVGDFWRIVVEKNISLIVMLNDLDVSENVPEFRPVNDEILTPVPHLKIVLKQKSHTNLWSQLKVQITDSSTNSGASQHQIVRIIHLRGWSPECYVPQEPTVLINLWQEVESHYCGKGPTLIMCLDGARACGLFLASAFVIEKMKLEQECDVCYSVRTVRHNRKQFVQSQEQFEFLYDVAMNYLEAFSIYSNFD